jgi:hypothetical protein
MLEKRVWKIAIFCWLAALAKWVIVAAGAILAVMSLFYQACCCRGEKKAGEGAAKV